MAIKPAAKGLRPVRSAKAGGPVLAWSPMLDTAELARPEISWACPRTLLPLPAIGFSLLAVMPLIDVLTSSRRRRTPTVLRCHTRDGLTRSTISSLRSPNRCSKA